jgi:tetratricopeptide (TPR) repeat protein
MAGRGCAAVFYACNKVSPAKVRLRSIIALFALIIPLAAATAQSPAQDSARARVFFDQKRYAEAAAILERTRARENPVPADLILLGMCYTELGELDKAATALDTAALMTPHSVLLLDARGKLAFVQKKFADALESFREAHNLDPGDRNAVAGMAASLSNQGVELFGDGKVEAAERALAEAVQLDPRSLPALRDMGILQLNKGNLAASADYLERALAVSPNDIELLKLLFLVRNRQGDPAAILPILDRLIEVQPADPEPYAMKGRLLEQEGKKQEATGMFLKAVEKGSQDPLPYLRIGALRRDRYLLQDAVGRAVHLISSLEVSASQAMGKAGNADALRGLKLITTKIDDVRATLASSLTLLHQIDGDSLFAEDLARLQSWYPGSVDLLAALGKLDQEKGMWPDALTAWQGILKDHPLDGEAQAGAGLAYEKLGDKDQAIAAYRRAREIQPKNRDLYAALERLYAGRENELRQILLDISYRETRNVVLLREIAKLEDELGLKTDAQKHRARAAEIESGK